MEKKSKKSLIIGVTSLLLVMLIILGLTYAYYRTRIIGNNSNEPSISVISKKMEVVYEDGSDSMNMTGLIEPDNEKEYTKTFYIRNTGSEAVSYSVVLDEMTNEFKRNQDWQVTLTKNGEEVIRESDQVYLAVGTHQVLLGSETIAASETDEPTKDTYVLKLKYVNSEENQSEDMGMSLSFKVNIKEEQYLWNDAPVGSLLYALKINQPTGTEETTPGKAASKSNEARILATEDDYGTSYVYRGNVTNNYVTYSNMCWRIVRVQGDGTIKLALADWEHPCGTANGYSAEDNDSAFVADESGNARTDIAYKISIALNETDLVFKDSDIPPILSDWAENNNLDMSKLVNTEWCNDTALIEENISDYGARYVYYAASERLGMISGTSSPSLKCNTNGMNGTTGIESKAIRYENVLGILTADEVAFAGSIRTLYSEVLVDYYLQTNTSAENWIWTMSPGGGDEKQYSSIFAIKENKLEGCGYWAGIERGSVRPSVVLNSNVLINELLDTAINGNPGTIDNPYVIDTN